MKDFFQAKDIQNAVGIPKYRYEYLATKIGIKPDIDEVEGTGKSHRYNFKNVVQFAVAHHAGKLGMTPNSIRDLLSYMKESKDPELENLYDPNDHLPISIFVFDDPKKGKYYIPTYNLGESIHDLNLDLDGIEKNKLNHFNDAYKNLMSMLNKELAKVNGAILINIGKIKANILEKL